MEDVNIYNIKDLKVPIKKEELDTRIKKDLLSKWKVSNDSKGNDNLTRVFHFKEYLSGINFVQKVAEIAERYNHHPDIQINYKRVTINLWTHSQRAVIAESTITFADMKLAKEISAIEIP